MIDEGLGQNVGHDGDGLALKLGHPFVTQLLYDRIRTRTGEGRSSVSYDIIDASLTGDAAKLVGEDFTKVAGDFFDCASSVVELRDEVVTHPSGTGAAMYAMALTYLIDQEITATDIDRLANIRPSPMTTKFASFMKKKIDDRRHAAI
jgi:hypothetical protein